MCCVNRTEANENEWDFRFRWRMKELREAKGMTQTDLARALSEYVGLKLGHQPTIARIEAGDRPVRLGEAPFIAKELGTTVHAMVADEGTDDDLDLFLNVLYSEISGLSGALAEFEAEFDDPARAAYALSERAQSEEASLDEAVAGGSALAARIKDALGAFDAVMKAWDGLRDAVRTLEEQPYTIKGGSDPVAPDRGAPDG